jgi:hypothetical protein
MSEITRDAEGAEEAAEVQDGVDDAEVPEAETVEVADADADADAVDDEVDAVDAAEAVHTPDEVDAPAEVAEADEAEVAETVEDTAESTAGAPTEVTTAEVPAEISAETPAETPAETTEVLAPEPSQETVQVPAPAPAPAQETAPIPAPTPVPAFGQSVLFPTFAEPALPPPPPLPKPRKKFPWRWVGAVVAMLAVGAGCAFAVMAPQRTELPGLKTPSDGRYDFAPLVLPTLAPGQSDPDSSGNPGAQHISDIRKLLLSPPKGAVLDHSLPGATGWVSRSATLSVLGNEQAAEQLNTDGWRHTAGIAWKTPDGAETKIWLVQFIDSSAETDASVAFSSFDGGSTADPTSIAVADSTTANYVRVVKGSTATWYGQVDVDDAELLLEFTAPTTVGIAPFEQELDLQVELLQ